MSSDKYLPSPKRSKARSISDAFVQDGPEEKSPTVMFNVRIDEDLRDRFKMCALKEKVSMREIIEGLMRDYLGEHE